MYSSLPPRLPYHVQNSQIWQSNAAITEACCPTHHLQITLAMTSHRLPVVLSVWPRLPPNGLIINSVLPQAMTQIKLS